MADLNDQYKFVKEDEFRHALRNILMYVKFDRANDLQKSVEIVEQYLEGRQIEREK
jgi:vacuolar-type H+-ATPase subunit C/Vma6